MKEFIYMNSSQKPFKKRKIIQNFTQIRAARGTHIKNVGIIGTCYLVRKKV